MQRELKFRARAKSNGEWVYGYYSVIGDTSFISFMNDNHQWQGIEVNPETVGQYMELHDKQGKEIYEGDIVHRIWDDGGTKNLFAIKWDDNKCGWNISPKLLEVLCESAKGSTAQGFEVIGNIYEHPELLEVKK